MEMLTLISSGEQKFTVEKKIAIQSITIKNMVDGGSVPSVISLSEVDSETLSLVIEFLNKQASLSMDDMKGFFEDLEVATLLDLGKAASVLRINKLMDLVAHKVADLLVNKTVEEAREILNIKNAFTPEEEQAIRDEHPWAFEL